MAASFLVEFRLRGYAKEYARFARGCTLRKANELGVRTSRQAKFVPHITLFGGAETCDLRNVTREVEKIGRKYTLVPFKLGVKRSEFQNEDATWLYLDVQPSPELEQFRYELAQSLIRLEGKIHDTCQPYDFKSECKFHCALIKCASGDSGRFEQLSDYAETTLSLEAFQQHKASVFGKLFNIIRKQILREEDESDQGINQHLVRVTVLGRGSRIQREYDLILKKLLSRREALSRYWWRKTIEELKELRTAPREERLSISSKPVYFIADTHFDHMNIIRYVHRPFPNVAEMNQAMENNWNRTVADDDTVYFLGDWSFGWGARPATYWKRRLKGSIVSIRGSHDRRQSGIGFRDFMELHVTGYDFLLIHIPNPNDKHQTQEQKEKLENWPGWIIHGHVHNNETDKYPFINGKRKTINVSAELINYKPVSLQYLLSLDLGSIKRMRTIDSQPEKW